MRLNKTQCAMMLVAVTMAGLALLPLQAKSASKLGNKLGSSVVVVKSNLAYAGTKNPRQQLDVLLPKTRNTKQLPVIVYIHGGGWRMGNKEIGRSRIWALVASGDFAGVSVGYRLSQEAKWPAQIHDCKAAVRWVRANAKTYGLDPNRIAVWGSSAGGHLAAMLGTSCGDKAMEGTLGPHTKTSSKVHCVVDFFGPTDLLKLAGDLRILHSKNSVLAQLIGGPLAANRTKAATANPVGYVSKDDPPFLIVHGTRDPLVPHSQSKLLDSALGKVNVPCTLVTVDGGGHGQGFGKDVASVVRRFFDHHLRNVKSKWADQTVKAVRRR